MYNNLGVNWATSLLAFLAVVLAPAPVLFWKYGEKIRSKSKFAVNGPPMAKATRAVQAEGEEKDAEESP